MWKSIKQRKYILVRLGLIDPLHFIYLYQVDPIWCRSWVSFILTGLGIALLVKLMLNFCKFSSSMITLEIFRRDYPALPSFLIGKISCKPQSRCLWKLASLISLYRFFSQLEAKTHIVDALRSRGKYFKYTSYFFWYAYRELILKFCNFGSFLLFGKIWWTFKYLSQSSHSGKAMTNKCD